MNLLANAEHMSPVQVALEVARHELVTLNNLYVTDNKQDIWKTDTSKIIALLDEALKAIEEAKEGREED